jgi:hypothetical protein
MSYEREYTSRRQAIAVAIADALKGIDGTGSFRSNVFENVEPRLRFWDEVKDFPYISVSAGNETRQYQGGGYRDRYLTVTIRIYVHAEDPVSQLESIIEDVETVLEQNGDLQYKDKDGTSIGRVLQIKLISIDTDEGVLSPLGAGELVCEVHY